MWILTKILKMKEKVKECLVSSQGGLQDKSEKIEVAGTTVQESDSYVVDAEACKDAVQKIKEVAPEQILEVMPGLLTILDFNGIINVGKIKIGRLVMNRWPSKSQSIVWLCRLWRTAFRYAACHSGNCRCHDGVRRGGLRRQSNT